MMNEQTSFSVTVVHLLALFQGVVCSGEPAHVHEALPGFFEQDREDRSG